MNQTYECNFCTVDLTQFPIVIFRLKNMDPNLEDVKEFAELRNSIYEQLDERTVIVVDGTEGMWINSPSRIQMGKDQKEFSDLYFHLVKMSIMVLPNALIKMMLKGVNLVSKPKVPQKLAKSVEEAMNIAREAAKDL